MREIKFRAFGTKGHTPTDGKWCYGSNVLTDYLGDNKKDNHFPLTIFERYLQGNYYDKNTRCQFTGLLDRNGVEIYEGDILNDYEYGSIGIVSFEDGAFIVTCEGEFCNAFEWSGEEVIGNIYENL